MNGKQSQSGKAKAARVTMIWLTALVVAPFANLLLADLFWPHSLTAVIFVGYALGIAASVAALVGSARVLR